MITALLAAALMTVPVGPTAITDAVDACLGVETLAGTLETDDVDVLDDGHSVVVDGSRVFGWYDCLRAELELPEWTRQLLNASSSAGLVTVEVEGYTLLWVYDSSGPTVVIHDDDAV